MNNNPFSLAGKTILVTGASSGIGRETAIQCSRSGAKLIITGRDEERLNVTKEKLDGSGHKMIIADLSDSNEIDSIIKNLTILDGVVHSAGIINRIPLKMISEKRLAALMQINFFAPALLTQKIYKNKMFCNESSVVFVSSVASSIASLGNIMYMASKGATNSFMKGIAMELAEHRIRANAIQPGMIKTNLTSAISDDDIKRDIQRYPLGRYGKPEEVAWAAVYLLSDATKWMTGSLLTIDGGLTLR